MIRYRRPGYPAIHVSDPDRSQAAANIAPAPTSCVLRDGPAGPRKAVVGEIEQSRPVRA